MLRYHRISITDRGGEGGREGRREEGEGGRKKEAGTQPDVILIRQKTVDRLGKERREVKQ